MAMVSLRGPSDSTLPIAPPPLVPSDEQLQSHETMTLQPSALRLRRKILKKIEEIGEKGALA